MADCYKELKAFADWLETNPLSSIDQALWMHLFMLWQKNGSSDGFVVRNDSLMSKLGGISKPTLQKSRNNLIQKGRIRYEGVEKKKNSGRYWFIPFTAQTGQNILPDSLPDTTAHQTGKEILPDGLPDSLPDGLPVPLPEGLPDSLSDAFLQEGMNECMNDGMTDTHARAEKPLQSMQRIFRETFGRPMRQADWTFVNDYLNDGMQEEVIVFAFEAALVNKPDSPMYLWRILGEWFTKGIRTVADYRRDLEQKQIEKQKQSKIPQRSGSQKVIPMSSHQQQVMNAWEKRFGKQSG
ncbi:hypothetical protein CIG75_12910 [Tumebacillus algifaecis]|uniref:DnaB/C C-terminal domain-containing protein n=1 Tax=Tumebacillus algifaecis TaxID=1214604 RepID=A0A223D288_9BACL|nr:DnaD domain protein [Tumebacillus algifaecis]ASS75799.1 hypothetical protein CIG75_12910 [Tumebacillus algifaecis]